MGDDVGRQLGAVGSTTRRSVISFIGAALPDDLAVDDELRGADIDVISRAAAQATS